MEYGPDRDARWIGLLAVLLALPATVAASSPTSTIAHLPGVQINAAKVDASGNIYLAGQTTTSAGSGAAWVAKLSRDGATTFYTATLGGSGSSVATALDIDSAGAAYVAGTTTGQRFSGQRRGRAIYWRHSLRGQTGRKGKHPLLHADRRQCEDGAAFSRGE